MKLKDIIIERINLGSKLAFLGLTLVLTVGSINSLTEENYDKTRFYTEYKEVIGALGLSYFLAVITGKYLRKI